MKRSAFTANLDTALAGNQMILVKVPEYVEKEWMRMIEESMKCTDGESDKLGAVLGRVDQHTNGEETSLELSEAASDGGRIPKKYKMKEKDSTDPQTFVVLHNEKNYTVKGQVKSLFPAAPEGGAIGGTLDAKYSQITGDRERAANMPKNVTQMSQDGDIADYGRSRRAKHITLARDKVQRHRLTQAEFTEQRSELEAELFRRFEQSPSWTMANLMKVSGLAPAYLKDLLSGMAVLNKGGPMKHQWTLQKDFVYTAEAADTEGGAAMQ